MRQVGCTSLVALLLLAGSVAAQEEPTVFDQAFAALYPQWDELGGQDAQVLKPLHVRVTYEVLLHFAPDGGAATDVTVTLPVPANTPRQTVLEFLPSSDDARVSQSKTGQLSAEFQFEGAEPGETLTCGWEALLDLSMIIHPVAVLNECTDTALIPAAVKQRYLGDAPDLDLESEAVQAAAEEVRGRSETLPESVAMTYGLVADRVRYVLDDRGSTVPEVLERGTGACGEYANCMIAICRALGIPARRLLATTWTPDSVDTVFHALLEIYYPDYGWVSFDPTWGKGSPAERARRFGTMDPRVLLLSYTAFDKDDLHSYSCRYAAADPERMPIIETADRVARWQPAK
jgi:hypothetical protein